MDPKINILRDKFLFSLIFNMVNDYLCFFRVTIILLRSTIQSIFKKIIKNVSFALKNIPAETVAFETFRFSTSHISFLNQILSPLIKISKMI